MGPTNIYASMRHDALPAVSPPGAAARFWGPDGFTFADILDLVNPLQHIPVIAPLYRAITGDALAPGARILGGALYGGVTGLVSSVVNAMIEETTGADIGGHVIAALMPGEGAPAAPTAIAARGDPPPPVVAALEPERSPAVPPLLTRTPGAEKPFSVLPAGYTRRPSEAELLTLMGAALDKYEQSKTTAAGSRLDRRL